MSDLDANKTTLTHRITGLAMAFLAGGGFKPVETEVPVAEGWIADLASFIFPTPTECKKLKLDKRFTEGDYDDWWSNLQFRVSFPITAIIEVKTSKSDFEKDNGRKYIVDDDCRHILMPPAHLCYLAYPAGMIEDDKLPNGWLGLKCSKDGSKLLKRTGWMRHGFHQISADHIAYLIAQVAIRRHHRTAYHEMRQMVKSWRAQEKSRKHENIVNNMIYGIARWVRGEESHYDSLEKMLRIECPKYLQDDLQFLEGLRK